jgi:ribosome biogenesis GTPase
MELTCLGYTDTLQNYLNEQNLEGFEIARVIAEHKERYALRTAKGEYEAEITGNMRFTARGREDFPAVGDWVAVICFDPDFAVIHQILPRSSMITRQAVGQSGGIQIIAANIDYALIVQSVDRDFSINRLERYLTICHASGVKPVIVITKTDLVEGSVIHGLVESVQSRIKDIPVFAISNASQDGYEALKKTIQKAKTYCMLGSSGVGKSTLLNNLAGKNLMKTGEISQSTARGKHVTSHRELIILENGGIMIDNPGMREVGIADTSDGLETTFDLIIRLSEDCRYSDCTHTGEAGCAVLEALEKGELDKNSYENYMKMEREKAHFESTLADRKKKDKMFGKIVKDYYNRDVKQKNIKP